MKLPFFYPVHPKFKRDVKYVTAEIWRFHQDADDLKIPYRVAEKRAKDIVLQVGSRKVPWWELLWDRLHGNQNKPVDDMFQDGLERYLRDAINNCMPFNPSPELVGYRAALLHKLDIADTEANE